MRNRRRIFTPEAAAMVRMQFQAAGASIQYPRNNDNRAVQLNEIDMDYRGFVPLDIAQDITQGRIAHQHIPAQYHSPIFS